MSSNAGPNLVFIFGPPAVGKMTVGRALAEKTGFRLLHNHMTIELLLNFFEFGSAPFSRLNTEFRRMLFRELADSELPGVIFTFMWALDLESERGDVDEVVEIFESRGARVFFVELEASLEARLLRNRHEDRLAAKASKRDVISSEKRLLASEEAYRLNTEDDFFYPERHLKIENTDLSPAAVAERIVEFMQAKA